MNRCNKLFWCCAVRLFFRVPRLVWESEIVVTALQNSERQPAAARPRKLAVASQTVLLGKRPLFSHPVPHSSRLLSPSPSPSSRVACAASIVISLSFITLVSPALSPPLPRQAHCLPECHKEDRQPPGTNETKSRVTLSKQIKKQKQKCLKKRQKSQSERNIGHTSRNRDNATSIFLASLNNGTLFSLVDAHLLSTLHHPSYRQSFSFTLP